MVLLYLIFYVFTIGKKKIAITSNLTTEMPEYGTNESWYQNYPWYPDCYPNCPPPVYTDCDSGDDDPTNDCESESSNETAKHEIPDIKETLTEGKWT